MAEKQLRALSRLASLPPAPPPTSITLVGRATGQRGAERARFPVAGDGGAFAAAIERNVSKPKCVGCSATGIRTRLGGDLACEIARFAGAFAAAWRAGRSRDTRACPTRLRVGPTNVPPARKTDRPTDDLESGSNASNASARFLQSAGLRLKQIWAGKLGPDDADPEASMQAAALLFP